LELEGNNHEIDAQAFCSHLCCLDCALLRGGNATLGYCQLQYAAGYVGWFYHFISPHFAVKY